ncbi:MAG TPA: type IX secretion system outer membrane channel protein PorV [Rubricoccaceae bacterium]|jgi:long-subunit fatty acid transport protein|nr:type IX secretion system outer membrane channel protein PorV [Rubricoccaceae bacterium]
MNLRRFRPAALAAPASAALLVAGVLLAGAARPASAQIVQTTAVPFLQIEPDSRAAGMGMTGVAVADNASALFWNPAGLAGQEGAEVTFTHAPWLPNLGADLFFEYLAGKYAVPGVGTFAGHITFLNLGEQTATDPDGNELGEFKSYDLAVGASYGRQVLPTLSVGGGARFIYSNLSGNFNAGGEATKAGTALALDLGVLWRPDVGSENIHPSLGLNLANMGPHISYSVASDRGGDAIPSNIRLGGALEYEIDDFNRVTFAVDANKLLVARKEEGNDGIDNDGDGEVDEADEGGFEPFTSALFSSWKSITVDLDGGEPDNAETVGLLRQFTYGLGAEYWYNDLFAIRTGYFYEDPLNGNRQFLTFGAGIRYSLVGVDLSYIYALEENSPLSEQIRFSVMLNVNR